MVFRFRDSQQIAEFTARTRLDVALYDQANQFAGRRTHHLRNGRVQISDKVLRPCIDDNALVSFGNDWRDRNGLAQLHTIVASSCGALSRASRALKSGTIYCWADG